jgi:AhpD family alkylhydroperoxidase
MSHRQGFSRHGVGDHQKETSMTTKINIFAAAPGLLKDWQRASIALGNACNLEPRLIGLVKLRASQINGCANCLNLHATEAREHGETEQRIYLLPAWQEAPCYSERERAALEWTEVLTRLSEERGLKASYETLRKHFSEEEQVKLTLAIININGWNRLAVGFGVYVDPAEIRKIAQLSAA